MDNKLLKEMAFDLAGREQCMKARNEWVCLKVKGHSGPHKDATGSTWRTEKT